MPQSRIAILTPRAEDRAESFIRNHISHLPFDITVIHGDYLPWKSNGYPDDRQRSMLERGLDKLLKRDVSEQAYRKQRLRQILTEKKIEAVLGEYILSGSAVADICAELCIPLIATGLGYEVSVHSVLEKNELTYRRYLEVAACTIVVSRNMMDTLEKFGGDRKKMIWSAAGPSEAFFDLQSDRSSKDLFMLGRLIEKKAPHLVLLAFSKVIATHPDARLLIGGDGPLMQVCTDLVAGLGIGNQVEFLGRIDQDAQREILKTARAFVQHSKVASDGDMEGTPVAIVEASGAAVPIISTLHSGIPDTVAHGKTGLLSEEGDVAAMAEHMDKLLSDKALADTMGEAGRVFMRENFSLESHIETITAAIEQSIAGQK